MFRAQRQEEQEKQRRNSAASKCRSGGVTLGTCKQSFLYFHKRLTQKAIATVSGNLGKEVQAKSPAQRVPVEDAFKP